MNREVMMHQHVARLELVAHDVVVRLVAVDVGKRVAVGAGKETQMLEDGGTTRCLKKRRMSDAC